MALKNLFCTVLTYAAPSSNYRGESEENRTIIQKVTKGDHEYAVISPESMRNALARDPRAARVADEPPRGCSMRISSRSSSRTIPNADIYADDFLFGYLVADNKEMKKLKRPAKRDSVLRMNMAVALQPYRFDATFHQSPLNAGDEPVEELDDLGAAAPRGLAHRVSVSRSR